MANTYYKVLNNKTAAQYSEEIIASIRNDLSRSARRGDIFETIKKLDGKDNLDMSFLLKCYAINKILENTSSTNMQTNNSADFTDTDNKNYKKSLKDNYYYRVTEDGEYVVDKNIVSINKDGTYEKIEQATSSKYSIKRLYNADDTEISMQLINPNGQIVKDKMYIVSILNLRKEYVQRFKYSGFSGNSNDVFALICNKLCSPIETGYFMDKYFHLYKWSDSNNCFVRNNQIESLSPLLTDYEFANGQKVVKKEYIGV